MSYKFNPFTGKLDKTISYWDRDSTNGYVFPKELNDWVGIGKNNPTAPLNVNGDLLVDSANGRIWGIDGLASGHTVYFQFGGDSSNRIENTFGSFTRFRSYWGTIFQCFQGEVARFGTSFNSIDAYFNGNVGFGTQTPAHRVDVNGSLGLNIQRNTTTATIDGTAYQWNGNTDSAGFTYTLPVGVQDRQYKIVNTGTSNNLLTITPDGSENLIGENSSFSLNDGESLIIGYDATDGWY